MRMFRWNSEAMMEAALLVFAGLMGAASVVLAASSVAWAWLILWLQQRGIRER